MANESDAPIVYTIRGCDASVKLMKKWDAEGIDYDERRVELSQATLEEAYHHGKLVPIALPTPFAGQPFLRDPIPCERYLFGTI